jgi:hypothetical protein
MSLPSNRQKESEQIFSHTAQNIGAKDRGFESRQVLLLS